MTFELQRTVVGLTLLAVADKRPIHLQFHGNPTRFRNIWVRENVAPLIGKKP